MELKQLRYFKAVAEELHFQRAARKVNITQPALSHQMKTLEEELGVVLLERDRRSVALSEAGKVLLAHVNEVLHRLDRAVDEVKNAAGVEKQTLKIGTRFFINLKIIIDSIIATKALYPHIDIEQIDMPTNEVPDAVKEGTIDIGFTPAAIDHPALIVKKVIEGYFAVILAKGHALAHLDDVPITELKDQPLIFFDKALNPKLYKQCVGYFEDAGFNPKIVMETNQVQTGLRMAAEGQGLFFLANYVATDLPDDLTVKKITGFDNYIDIKAVWHEGNTSKALKVYLAELRKL